MLNVPKQVEEIYTPLVFGIPVTEACKNCGTTSNVPQVVEDCLNYLISREAYKEEGIFRISGIYTQINMLKKMYDKGELVNINDCDEVHTVSGLLKLYYRELPESPFTLSLISPINETDSIESVNDRIEALSTVLSKLSIYNASVLLHLFKFLNLVIQYVNENKMGLSNLGIIFLPALDISQGSFSFLVSNYDLTFSKTIEKIKAKNNNNKNSPSINRLSQSSEDVSKGEKKKRPLSKTNPFSLNTSQSPTQQRSNPFQNNPFLKNDNENPFQ